MQREGNMNKKSTASLIVNAIKDENVEVIRGLFENDPPQKDFITPFGGQTWLGYSAQIGKLSSLQELERIGISIDKGDIHENIRPICGAVAGNHIEIVEYLLSKEARLDTDISVRNPLFAAIVGNSLTSIKLLLDAGIDAEARYNSDTMQNMDALAFALMRGCVDGAELIAKHISEKNNVDINKLISEADKIATMNAFS